MSWEFCGKILDRIAVTIRIESHCGHGERNSPGVRIESFFNIFIGEQRCEDVKRNGLETWCVYFERVLGLRENTYIPCTWLACPIRDRFSS